jgi:hypothetical protein
MQERDSVMQRHKDKNSPVSTAEDQQNVAMDNKTKVSTGLGHIHKRFSSIA